MIETLAVELARITAFWHILFGFYLIFLASPRTGPLLIVGFLKSLFGVCVYLIVIRPEWVFEFWLGDVLLPMTLLLILILSMIMSWLIWEAFDLDNPYARIRTLYDYHSPIVEIDPADPDDSDDANADSADADDSADDDDPLS